VSDLVQKARGTRRGHGPSREIETYRKRAIGDGCRGGPGAYWGERKAALPTRPTPDHISKYASPSIRYFGKKKKGKVRDGVSQGTSRVAETGKAEKGAKREKKCGFVPAFQKGRGINPRGVVGPLHKSRDETVSRHFGGDVQDRWGKSGEMTYWWMPQRVGFFSLVRRVPGGPERWKGSVMTGLGNPPGV